MKNPRRMQILQAIVEDYVHSREPVGSKALVERHQLGVSSATVRNDMAALEEDGLIAAPHTSSGRVPTDKGYRAFVDQIGTVRPLSTAEKRAIQALMDGADDIDDLMERTARLLSQLTQQVAVIQYPRVSTTTVRHVDLLPLEDRQCLVILILSDGRVLQRLCTLVSPPEEHALAELRGRVLAATAGLLVSSLPPVVDALATDPRYAFAAPLMEALSDLSGVGTGDRMVLAGTANLARSTGDFHQSIGPVLEALEEQVVMLRLLSEMEQDAFGMSVRIGSENTQTTLAETAVVAAGYGPGELSKIGVVGPTRMDYPATMAAVRAVARYVSRILAQ